MFLDNDIFKAAFLAVAVAGLLFVWADGAPGPSGQKSAGQVRPGAALELNQDQKQNLAKVSGSIDAALREQMRKLSGRVVNLLTVGPSPSKLESATIRSVGELFSKVKIRSVSDLPEASYLVSKWRDNPSVIPAGLKPVLLMADLTVVQWLESEPEGLVLHTWYVKKDGDVVREAHPWGEGTLPQVTIDKLHRVILDPGMRIDG